MRMVFHPRPVDLRFRGDQYYRKLLVQHVGRRRQHTPSEREACLYCSQGVSRPRPVHLRFHGNQDYRKLPAQHVGGRRQHTPTEREACLYCS
jgi:hypothetical protein